MHHLISCLPASVISLRKLLPRKVRPRKKRARCLTGCGERRSLPLLGSSLAEWTPSVHLAVFEDGRLLLQEPVREGMMSTC